MSLKNINSKHVKICVKLEIMKLKYKKIPINSLILAIEDRGCEIEQQMRNGEVSKRERKIFVKYCAHFCIYVKMVYKCTYLYIVK